jgi:4-alpha-glucanotransferase
MDPDTHIVWSMIKAAASSVARTCIFPLQDILHLGSEARMNTPAAAEGNWSWRFSLSALHPDFATQLAAIMEMTDRDGYQKPIEGITAGGPTDHSVLRILEGSQT